MLHKRCRCQQIGLGRAQECMLLVMGPWVLDCVAAARVCENGTAIDIPCMHTRSAAVLFSTSETSRLRSFDLNSICVSQTYGQPTYAARANMLGWAD